MAEGRPEADAGSTGAEPIMLLTRAWPVAHRAAAFDQWQRSRHIPEIVGSGLLEGAAYYVALGDAVPPAWVGPGLRMAVYYAENVATLGRWMLSPGLREALSDGETWFGDFHRLDGRAFTGNVYEAISASDRAAPAVLVSRLDLSGPGSGADASMAEFLRAQSEVPGVTNVSSWSQVDDDEVPISYYRSPGRRMCWTEFRSVDALLAGVGSEMFGRAAREFDHLTGDGQYATHEAYSLAFRCDRSGGGVPTL